MPIYTAIRIVISIVSASLGIAIMISLANISAVPLGTIPFATSIVLVASAPRSGPARTKAIIAGHLICGAAGLLVHQSGFEATSTVAVAVGVSVGLMLALNVLHPPAGITPLVLYGSDLTWNFLLVPVLVGAVSVAILARTAEKLTDLADRLEAAALEARETDQGAQR